MLFHEKFIIDIVVSRTIDKSQTQLYHIFQNMYMHVDLINIYSKMYLHMCTHTHTYICRAFFSLSTGYLPCSLLVLISFLSTISINLVYSGFCNHWIFFSLSTVQSLVLSQSSSQSQLNLHHGGLLRVSASSIFHCKV